MLLVSIVRPAAGSNAQVRTERRVNWKLPEPSNMSTEEMRSLRDEIEKRVLALIGKHTA